MNLDIIDSVSKFIADRYLVSTHYSQKILLLMQDDFESLDRTACTSPSQIRALAVCDEIKDKPDPGLDDVRRFQWAMVSLYDEATLTIKSEALVREFKILAELDEKASTDLDQQLKSLAGNDLRMRLGNIVQETNGLVTAKTEIWNQKINLSKWSFILLNCSVVIFLVSWFFNAFWLMVIGVGIAGGVVSTQQRIIVRYATDVKWVRGFINPAPYINATLSAMFGGISAMILFFILQSQILTTLGYDSKWVPHFQYGEQEFKTLCQTDTSKKEADKADAQQSNNHFSCMTDKVLNNPPKSPMDMALLFLFSFLAGFSERLVTDLLDKITVKISDKQQST